jgi:hypothetical protein
LTRESLRGSMGAGPAEGTRGHATTRVRMNEPPPDGRAGDRVRLFILDSSTVWLLISFDQLEREGMALLAE